MNNLPYKILLIGMVFSCMAASIQAENTASLDHASVNWTELQYSASTFLVSAKTTLRIGKNDEALLDPGADDVVMPGQNDVYRIENESEAMGKRTRYLIWFDSGGAVLQRTRIRRGSKNDIKVYRYTQCGYISIRKKFSDSKFDEQFNDWDPAGYKTRRLNSPLCDSKPVVQGDSLSYLVSTLNWQNKGDSFRFTAVSSGKLFDVSLQASKKTHIDVDYTAHGPEGKQRIETEKAVWKIEVKPAADRKKFRFLGLKGKISLFYDPETRLILRIRGDVDYLGTVDINLASARFR